MRAAHRADPVRPSISPLMWCAAAVWVSSRAGTEAALRCWLDGSGRPEVAVWGALALFAFLTPLLRPRALRPMALVCVLVFAVALAHAGALTMRASALEASGPGTWSGTVAADGRSGVFGTTVEVRLDAARSGPAVSVSWPEKVPVPVYGERVALDGRLRARLREDGAADSFRRGDLLRMKPWKVAATGWAPPPLGWVAAWRASVVGTLARMGGEGPESLACMLLAAAPGPAAERVIEDARTAGVAWAVTTSGLHLASIVAMVGALAGMLGCGRRGRALATVAALALVVSASGLRLSLLRAALAAGAATLGRLVGRRRDSTATLGATVLLLVALDPAAAYDLGLLMGALALTAIASFAGLAGAWLRPMVGRGLSRALGASLAAQVGVAAVSASMFGGLAVAGPVTLALTAPLVGGAVSVGLLAATLAPLSTGAAEQGLRLAATMARGAGIIWATISRVPGVFLATPEVRWWGWLGWAAGVCGLWLGWPLPRRAARVRIGALAASLLIAGSMVAAVPTGPRIDVLDVGQGDAILVRDGSRTLLVDTGADPVVLRRALARAGVRSLDGLVLTHAHDDHTGGLSGLAGVARPDWIGVPDVVDESVDRLAVDCARRTGTVVRLRRDMAWTVGSTRVRVLWPAGGERRLDSNDTSVVLLVEQRGGRALLLGDAEDRAQRGALDAWAAPVEMLKVAHHGSPNGNMPEALELWSPPIALISVGEGNRFGHPSSEALESLAAVGARISRTDLEGDLTWQPGTALSRVAAAVSRSLVCDNPSPKRGSLHDPRPTTRTVVAWRSANSTISSPSTSSTAPRSCCWSARRGACGTAWLRSPTSISTWRRSTAARPPPTRSSTRPTRCRS